MIPRSIRICVPNLVAVRRSCRKKGVQTDSQTDKGTLQLYIVLAGYPASLGRKGGREGREGGEGGEGGEVGEAGEGGRERRGREVVRGGRKGRKGGREEGSEGGR